MGHRKRVGKNTFADLLVAQLKRRGVPAERASFADKMKFYAYLFWKDFGLRMGDEYDRPETEHLKEKPLPGLGLSPRDCWIGLGMGLRKLDPDIWVRLSLEKYDGLNRVIVFSDVRFPNEAEAIRARDGLLVRVDRRKAVLEHDGDVADDALPPDFPWDITLTNDHDLNSLDWEASVVADTVEGKLRERM